MSLRIRRNLRAFKVSPADYIGAAIQTLASPVHLCGYVVSGADDPVSDLSAYDPVNLNFSETVRETVKVAANQAVEYVRSLQPNPDPEPRVKGRLILICERDGKISAGEEIDYNPIGF